MEELHEVLDVAIIGGGLAGCVVAYKIEEEFRNRTNKSRRNEPQEQQPQQRSACCSWQLFEARTVLGGRLMNAPDEGHPLDLGGAWIWPESQPQMRNIILTTPKLNITTFPQPDDMTLSGAVRIEGGAMAIIQALVQNLPSTTHSNNGSNSILTNTPIVSCRLISRRVTPTTIAVDNNENNSTNNDNVTDTNDEKPPQTSSRIVELKTTTGKVYFARSVVLTVPPRLLHDQMTFAPALSSPKWSAMAQSPTWMAGVTKIAFVYTKKWWTAELSTMPLVPFIAGPAFQVYDASTRDGTVPALTFFAFVANDDESEDEHEEDTMLADRVATQFAANLSSRGTPEDIVQHVKKFKNYYVQRWPREHYISENRHPVQIHPHPSPLPILSAPDWEGRLIFAGTETAATHPGMMEGAVGSAIRAVQDISKILVEKESVDVF